ncbi:uncharacterized protein LOC130690088 [Daphnia carinata]|uniref:uncharacterized protein LOC130690088 n=1 Tax=Daphnia carinata TaxID=120202 RepID=UPI00257C29FC|nr:uncharacterized protein LOC130690088 [Daphnia carinata]
MKLTAILIVVSSFVIVLAQSDRQRTRAVSRGEITFNGNANFGETSRIRSRGGAEVRSSRRVDAKPNSEAKPRFISKSRDTRIEPKPNVQAKPNSEAKPRFVAKPRETRVEAKPIRVEPKPNIESKPRFTVKPKAEDRPKPTFEVKPKVEERFTDKETFIEEDIPKAKENPSLETEGKPSIDVDDNTVTGNPMTEIRSNGMTASPFADVNGNTVEANATNCQQNDLLNRLLLRVLLSSMTTTTQNPLMENINRLFNINPTTTSPTTVITSTAVSTVTQLFSTIVNVMFRNRKLPTTIYSSSTLVVTEIQTVTSTLSSQNPSALFRFKRDSEVTEENQLQSSLLESNSISKLNIEPTQPLPSADVVYSRDDMEPAIDIDRLMTALNHPEIRDAWNRFLQVLSRFLE